MLEACFYESPGLMTGFRNSFSVQ